MAGSIEGWDAIAEAEAIRQQTREEFVLHHIVLPEEILEIVARIAWWEILPEPEEFRAVLLNREDRERLSQAQEEELGMSEALWNKLQRGLTVSRQGEVKEAAVWLSGREVDVLDAQLIGALALERNAGQDRSAQERLLFFSEETQQQMRDLHLRNVSQLMGAMKTLDNVFVKAGGTPRKAWSALFEEMS